MQNEPRLDETASIKAHAQRVLKMALGLISLTALAIGLAIHWFAGDAGLPQESANAAAFGMLLTAIAHGLALAMWDRG